MKEIQALKDYLESIKKLGLIGKGDFNNVMELVVEVEGMVEG